jgi:hypothetical protein
MIPAVNICLREGDTKLAKTLLESGYYPSQKQHFKLIQNILLYLPTQLVKRII